MFERALSWFGSKGDSEQAAGDEHATHEATGGQPGDGTAPVCVGIVEGPLRAEIARTYLEQAGIAVFLQGESLAGVYGFTSGPLGAMQVLVPASQAEEAMRIFGELDFSGAADTE
jgi:hypothetical protein